MPVRQRKKVWGFKMFRNHDKKLPKSPDYGNAKLSCFDPILKQIAPITFSPDKHYELSGWIDGDEIGVSINEITMVESADNIADGISQGGFKPIAEAIETQHYPEGRQEAPEQAKAQKRW
tara:strand:+ start:564 stop:923 length:360 start_codon:yes stop_codon:yes gene_type:complete